jgi:hypothetical protein
VVGVLANTCVEATARWSAELGYHVTLVRDATAAFSSEAIHPPPMWLGSYAKWKSAWRKLSEAVIMLIAMIVAARWVIRRFDVPRMLSATISMGLMRF